MTFTKRALILLFFSLSIFSTYLYSASSFQTGWDNYYQTQNGGSLPSSWGAYFRRQSNSTSSGNTGPNYGAEGSSTYLYFEASSGWGYTAGDTAVIETGTQWQYQVQYANQMSFFYHMFGADIGTLSVEVNSGSNNSWETIWQISGQQQPSSQAAWRKQTLNLDFYRASLGSFNRARFKVVAAGGYRGDIGIDLVDFTSSNAPDSKVYRYDALGRLVCVVDHTNGDRKYTYDEAGNRENVAVGVDCGE
jgi:hypothetical protein